MGDIARDATTRITRTRFAESLVARSKAVTGAVSTATSLLTGQPAYYLQLVSARNFRNALEGRTNVIRLSAAGLALSYASGCLLILKALLL